VLTLLEGVKGALQVSARTDCVASQDCSRPIKRELLQRLTICLYCSKQGILQPSRIFLQEDGIELWRITMQQATVLTTELADLIPLVVTLLREGTDVLRQVLKLVESYCLLDAGIFLRVRYF
jgi:hypothetical protein